ncbi:signal peptidase I [Streptomyces sp. NPDC013181]|uniref:signal peptidase I n=1 Tax=Streptomyces sp. NPDC013181 TaxID=3364864 RepID=UPI0036AF7F5A
MGRRGRRAAPAPGRATGRGAPEDAARSLPTRAERRKLARRVKRRRRRSAVREIPLLIVVALAIALLMKTFLVQAFVIPSGSMEQTIRIGDRVLVDKLTPWFGSKPHRGDVVVFRNPPDWPPPNPVSEDTSPVGVKQVKQALTFVGLLPSDDEQDLIKRVVAVGGDTVRCCGPDGRLSVNGVAVDEPYVFPGDSPSAVKFEVKVPPGRLFVMGDHRSNSADSRFHLDRTAHGTIAEDAVVGRAKWIVWPFGHWAGLAQRSAFAAVPDARAGSAAAPGPSNSVSEESNRLIRLPTPAELPLVMGVVGLHRLGRRRLHGVRSGCGGFGGRRTIRTRRTRGPAGQPGAFRARRRGGGRDDGERDGE